MPGFIGNPGDRHLVLRNAGRAVEDDGEAGKPPADFFENVEAKLGILTGLEFISAVRSADSDGEGIDPRAGGEFLHFVGRSEQRVVRLYLDVVLDASIMTEVKPPSMDALQISKSAPWSRCMTRGIFVVSTAA